MLIKLTAAPHPDLNGGLPWPTYIDASRILSIGRAMHQFARLDRQMLKTECYDEMYFGIQRLVKLLGEKLPTEIDTQEAAKWAKELHMASHEVQSAYQVWGRAFNTQDLHPSVECTEIQLACGTALEHGVMLARHWVTESPEEVAEAIAHAGRSMEARHRGIYP